MKVVLDTNVFISGIHWRGVSNRVIELWLDGRFEIVSSLQIIEEFINVLMEFKVPLEPADIFWWKDLILEKATMVIPKTELNIVEYDPKDNKFFEAALEGKADYIVSQDRKHVLKIKEYKGIKTIHPEEFVKLFE